MNSKCHTTTIKQLFLDLNQVAFWDCQEAEIEFVVPGAHLKHRFYNPTEVAFWAVQGAEYKFAVPVDHLKHCFLDLFQVVFWNGQEDKSDPKCLASP